MTLCENFPSFDEDLRKFDEELARLPQPPTWSIREYILHPLNEDSFLKGVISQPLCIALQIAMVNLLRRWGVEPDVVLGHSSGEIAAAYASGALSMRDAIQLSYRRGQSLPDSSRGGGMVVVGLGRAEVMPYLRNGVTIGCENSPSNVTLSGDEKTLEQIVADIKFDKPETFIRTLKVDMAYHSHHMEEIADVYAQSLSDLRCNAPQVPFYSTTFGRWLTNNDVLDVSYWKANLTLPVLFNTAVRGILEESSQRKVFLEIGPHAALRGPLRQCFRASSAGKHASYIPTLIRDADSHESLLNTVGSLFCNGADIDFSAVMPSGNVLTDLPTYPWHYERYWKESRVSKSWRFRKFQRHDLLGSPILENNELEPAWRNILRLSDVPWICDHQVGSNIVFPGAGYVTIAGEAIRQIVGAESYTVRNVTILAAMILREGQPTEIMTSLKPHLLTGAQVSAWYDFTVSSSNNDAWTTHCRGQVRGDAERLNNTAETAIYVRKVSSQRWYQSLRKVGFKYGPSFSRLEQISAAVDRPTAAATIPLDRTIPGSGYAVHPAALDMAFQAFCVADCKGKTRDVTGIYVPTYIKELSVRPAKSDVLIKVDVDLTKRICGSVVGVADGDIVIRGEGLQMSPLEDGNDNPQDDLESGAQLEWMPHIRYLDMSTLFQPTRDVSHIQKLIEQITLLAIAESAQTLSLITGKRPHLEQYRHWILSMAQSMKKYAHPVWSDFEDCLLPSEQRLKKIGSHLESIKSEDDLGLASGAATAVFRIFQHLPDIIEDKVSPLEILLEDNILSQYYDFGELFDYGPFLKHLVHEKPNLNILEIGGGTGSTTSRLLPYLYSSTGERMFSTYAFTDISEGFLSRAKTKFQQHPAINYMTFDITKGPSDQGIPLEFYDLIIANNVVHSTPSLHQTLKNISKVVHPRGFLVLQELCSEAFFTSFVMGGLEGWWLGEADNRASKPYVSPERWDCELKQAGFSGTDVTVYDHPAPFAINALMVAAPTCHEKSDVDRVTLLVQSKESTLVQQIANTLSEEGIAIDFCYLNQSPRHEQLVISLLDVDNPFLFDISEANFVKFTRLLTRLNSQSLLWLTRTSQLHSEEPRHSLILGMARNARLELGLDFATLEVNTLDSTNFNALPSFVRKYRQSATGSDTLDYDYALINGVVQIGRYHWYSINSALSYPSSSVFSRKLTIAKKGLLQTLRWEPQQQEDLAEDSVVVDIAAVGMNFRDVMVAMGVITAGELGIEAAGTVLQVGTAVNDLKVGDRVVVTRSGCFATRTTVPRANCVRISDSLGFGEAATMYGVYCTSVLSLMNIAKIEKGNTVLIHSACGGIGLSAIQICQMVGAEIFATVGSDEKVRYLQETYNIPSDHILNSHNVSFRDALMTKTNKRGVDVVLNSLSGELLHASWDCVADFGVMAELGKRDIQERGKLDMSNFSRNRGYYAVDYEQILTENPVLNMSLMNRVTQLYSEGKISPVTPLKVFTAQNVEEAFRYFQKGQHIGKIVVSMPNDTTTLATATSINRNSVSFNPDAAYLLVGGLGGLGRAVSIWMAERGARHLVYLSRSGDDKSGKLADFFNELAAFGCGYRVFRGSVANQEDVERVVRDAKKPIRGVMQMAMELKDCNLNDMSFEEWKAATTPKIHGTWNLHNALLSQPEALDFFVLFSSQNGLYGWYGQSNYVAGNAFQDAFVSYRRRQGLAASVLNIGPVDEIGFVAEANPSVAGRMRSTFRYFLPEKELLDAVELAVVRSQARNFDGEGSTNPSQIIPGFRPHTPSLVNGASDNSNNNLPWQRDSRFLVYRNIESSTAPFPSSSSTTSSESILATFIASCARDHSVIYSNSNSLDILTQAISSKIRSFLLLNEDDTALDVSDISSLSLAQLGVDSLVAIELRNWWRQRLGCDISVLEILDASTIGRLGLVALEGLRGRFPLQNGTSQ